MLYDAIGTISYCKGFDVVDKIGYYGTHVESDCMMVVHFLVNHVTDWPPGEMAETFRELGGEEWDT